MAAPEHPLRQSTSDERNQDRKYNQDQQHVEKGHDFLLCYEFRLLFLLASLPTDLYLWPEIQASRPILRRFRPHFLSFLRNPENRQLAFNGPFPYAP